MKIILIGAGGAIGSALRYMVCGLDYKFSNGIFPVGTLVVNLAVSLIIGFLWGILEQAAVSYQGKAMYEQIVMKARQLNMAGATILRGLMGRG